MRATWKRIAALACAGLACTSAHARPDFPETEANDTKAAANAVTLAVGDSVSGTTTGTSTITAGNGSADYYRVKTGAGALGIYRHRLSLTSSTQAQVTTIRGLNQSAVGTIGTTDSVAQTGSTLLVGGTNTVQWYGFGKQEEIYYRVTGVATSTATYTSVLSTDAVVPFDVSTSISVSPGDVTIGPATGNTVDMDWWLYSDTLDPIACAGMDSGPVVGVRTVNLAAGTYYLAFSSYNFANNQASCAPETFAGIVLDFPNAASNSSTSTTITNINARFTSTAGQFETSGLTQSEPFLINWVKFTVAIPANPGGLGSATPAAAVASAQTEFKVIVQPGASGTLDDIQNPPNPSGVRVDVSALNGTSSPDWFYLVRDGVTADWKSTFTVPVSAVATTYSLPFEITQVGVSPGTGTGTIAFTVIPPPPANDNCTGAEVITTTPFVSALVDYSVATTDTNANPSCDSSSNSAGANRGVWWTFTAPSSGQMTVQRNSPSSEDTVTSIWTGTCAALTQLTTGGCTDGDGTAFTLNVTGGTTYYIMVSKWGATAPAAGVSVGLTLNFAAPPAVPANDECAGAEVVSSLPFVSALVPYFSATTDTNANPSCDSSSNSAGANRGVWWTYTPPADGIMTVQRNSPSSEDTVTSVWTGASCASLTQVATNGCLDADATAYNVSVVGGTTYYIMISKWSSAAPTSFATQVGLTLLPPLGVCCNSTTGVCTVTSASCPVGSVLNTSITTCGPTACPVTGTCCHDTNGLCTLVYGGGTCPTGTTLTGTGTTCVPNPCPPSGSCCTGNACTVLLETSAGTCAGSFTLGGTCSPTNPCFLSDNCETTDLIALMGTQVGTTVDSTTSFQITPGTLCPGATTSSGGYNDVFLKFVAPATATYTLDTCGPSTLDTILSIHSGPCATISSSASVLACNDDAGYPTGVGIACVGAGTTLTSRILSVNLVAGTEYYVRIGAFLTTARGAFTLNIDYVAGTQVGTCCSGATCTITDAANCSGGTHTVGAACEPNPCTPSSDFCCRGTTCNPVTAGTCTGTVAGSNSTTVASCGAGNSSASCCFADFNHTGGVTIDDLFLYLNAYFTSSPYSNFGGDTIAGPTIDDLFLYINAYFTGCQP